jgi:hypothetical protein
MKQTAVEWLVKELNQPSCLDAVMCRFSSQIFNRMNKTINQDGEIIICSGQEGSHIRNKEVYNKTMARLLCRIRSVWSYGGVDRHCDPQDLWDIMEADDIPKDKWKSLYNSAYYYFDVERGVR